MGPEPIGHKWSYEAALNGLIFGVKGPHLQLVGARGPLWSITWWCFEKRFSTPPNILGKIFGQNLTHIFQVD